MMMIVTEMMSRSMKKRKHAASDGFRVAGNGFGSPLICGCY